MKDSPGKVKRDISFICKYYSLNADRIGYRYIEVGIAELSVGSSVLLTVPKTMVRLSPKYVHTTPHIINLIGKVHDK